MDHDCRKPLNRLTVSLIPHSHSSGFRLTLTAYIPELHALLLGVHDLAVAQLDVALDLVGGGDRLLNGGACLVLCGAHAIALVPRELVHVLLRVDALRVGLRVPFLCRGLK